MYKFIICLKEFLDVSFYVFWILYIQKTIFQAVKILPLLIPDVYHVYVCPEINTRCKNTPTVFPISMHIIAMSNRNQKRETINCSYVILDPDQRTLIQPQVLYSKPCDLPWEIERLQIGGRGGGLFFYISLHLRD